MEDSQEKGSQLHNPNKVYDLLQENHPGTLNLKATKKVSPHHALYLDTKQYHISLVDRIPKRMVTVDEKYLRRCLELIHIRASKQAQCAISVNLSSRRTEKTRDLERFVEESPLTSRAESVAISPSGRWIVGSIMKSESMINILNSPLFHQSNEDVRGLIGNDFVESSSGDLSMCSSQKLQKETITMERTHRYESDSTNSKCYSDQSCFLRGMVQCTWKGGMPHFVFSADDQNEVYVASLRKTHDKALQYIYTFHSGKTGQEDFANLAAKMKVSSSFTLCPNNSQIVQTEFVLFGTVEKSDNMEVRNSSNNGRKNKGLSKKVVEVFKTSPSIRHRSSIKDYCLGEPYSNMDKDNLVETYTNTPPNFELVAIVVKDTVVSKNPQREGEVREFGGGGWGLKFLKKAEAKQTSNSECLARNSGTCSTSTSMDIIVPARFHGGPKTRNGGPSSLTERWRSNGHCDCGGWDMGCPLTVLKAQLNREDQFGQCKSFDIQNQGSEHGPPVLRMIDVPNGLYSVRFKPTLSSLQSFAIAVAIIHSQSSALKPGNVQHDCMRD